MVQQRKVLIIPYVRDDHRTKIVVVQHAESKDWTFISGTCEPGEGSLTCMTRELREETLDCVKLCYIPKNTEILHIVTANKHIKVFFIPIRKHSTLYNQFMKTKKMFEEGCICENSQLQFMTYQMFLRKRIWNFIRDSILNNPSFQRKLKKLLID